MTDAQTFKQCLGGKISCNQFKPLSEFYFDTTHNRYLNQCKECKKQSTTLYYNSIKDNEEFKLSHKQYNQKYQKEHRTERSAATIKWRQENPEKTKESNRKTNNKNTEKRKKEKWHQRLNNRFSMLISRAKKRNIMCTLTYEQFVECVSQPCYYCNFELGRPVVAGCGIDRLSSKCGYIDGNVVSCCTICNRIKGDFLTPEETVVAVKSIIEFRKMKENIK